MPKRWNPLRAAAWGACFGAIAVGLMRLGDPLPDTATTAGMISRMIGRLIGGGVGGGIFFGIGAVIRNLVVGAR